MYPVNTESRLCGVIYANCVQALSLKPNRIVIIATKATVQSRAYSKQLIELGFIHNKIIEIECPLFVPFIEENLTAGSAVEWIIDHYMGKIIREGDCVILGCTHYRYILETMKAQFSGTEWINSGRNLLKY